MFFSRVRRAHLDFLTAGNQAYRYGFFRVCCASAVFATEKPIYRFTAFQSDGYVFFFATIMRVYYRFMDFSSMSTLRFFSPRRTPVIWGTITPQGWPYAFSKGFYPSKNGCSSCLQVRIFLSSTRYMPGTRHVM